MGRCSVCNKDLGWFSEDVCEEHTLKYKDRVKVVSGFYKGLEGILTGEMDTVEGAGYIVQLADLTTIEISNSYDLKIIKQ